MLHRVVRAIGITLVAALVAIALLPSSFPIADVTGGRPASGSRLATPADRRLAPLLERYRCSTDGFGSSQIPGSAIIRRTDGRVAVVSFDRGWEVFKDDGPAALVAVCLRPPR